MTYEHVTYLISRGGVGDDGVAIAAGEARDPLPAALGVIGDIIGGQSVLGHNVPECAQVFGGVGSVRRGDIRVAVSGDVTGVPAPSNITPSTFEEKSNNHNTAS